MAQRKKQTVKKLTRKSTAAKKSPRKAAKAASKRATRKKTTRKKATSAKSAASRARAKQSNAIKRAGDAIARLETELPRNLRDYLRELRRLLDTLEREIQRMQATTRSQATRLLRDASHQFGAVEALGQRAWQRVTNPYRREAVQLLKRLEKVIEPKGGRGRVASTRKKASKR